MPSWAEAANLRLQTGEVPRTLDLSLSPNCFPGNQWVDYMFATWLESQSLKIKIKRVAVSDEAEVSPGRRASPCPRAGLLVWGGGEDWVWLTDLALCVRQRLATPHTTFHV